MVGWYIAYTFVGVAVISKVCAVVIVIAVAVFGLLAPLIISLQK